MKEKVRIGEFKSITQGSQDPEEEEAERGVRVRRGGGHQQNKAL